MATGRRKSTTGFVAVSALALLLSGCASFSGIKPLATMSDGYTMDGRKLDGSAAMNATQINALWPTEHWWQAYRDPQLDRLVNQAITDSPSIKVAQARIRQATALAGVAQAATLPKVGAAASITRELFTSDGLYPAPLGGGWDWSNDARIKASYDLDLWDKDRNTLEAALDNVRVSAAEARAAQLNLESIIVRSYLQLATQYVLKDIAEASLAQRQSIVHIAQRRLHAGIGTGLEVNQAETSLPTTRAAIEKINEAIALSRNQLAALTGQGPSAGDAIQRPTLADTMAKSQLAKNDEPYVEPYAELPISLPDNVPANLIGRRPDVIAQRWRVESMIKNIAVAKAAFYPNINISAFIGLESIGLSHFLTTDSNVRGFAPAISLPIFDGGRLRANLGAQTATLDAAIETYNNTLLQSLQSVADQIVKLKSIALQRNQSESAMTLATKSASIAQRGFKAGLTSYLNVIQTQMAMLQEQQQVAQSRAAYLDAWAQLMQALGGGLGDDLPLPTVDGTATSASSASSPSSAQKTQ
ncbi:efflux transporter outer membrane subunit [Glaciimonas immobilis]|uniref:NodT family efflux transporter outer membrane factor (OMF) lipoprotein n=1 Tax=Glaciimonas immobilis TaxID=728004 RepID=A0A840RW98_9BURK|nr:efflux transporter outer membrane subunit [Glaciimonas immobilis]KAF3997602.1 efflux transporter outer membrane subunit [Glaciimonas immobilis]MBB5200699.1 NodT family efflux transporter outer membrane factor (OMF) lipoprotein [Glaciimonas immobilis]